MALALQHPTAPTYIWGEYKHIVRALQHFIFAIIIVPILYSLWNSGSFWIHTLAIVLVIQILRALYKTRRKCIQLCAFIARVFFMERHRVLRLRLFGLLLDFLHLPVSIIHPYGTVRSFELQTASSHNTTSALPTAYTPNGFHRSTSRLR